MDWSIQEIAKLAGTTSRTLRHYDDIGLLAPARIGSNGYRYYDEAALVRLQRILLLRELGLGLPAIGDVLDREEPSAPHALREPPRVAPAGAGPAGAADRVGRARPSTALEGGERLMAENMFDGFDHTQYKEEVEQRWGKDAYAKQRRLVALDGRRGEGRLAAARVRPRPRLDRGARARHRPDRRRGAGARAAPLRVAARHSGHARRRRLGPDARSTSSASPRCTSPMSASARTTAARPAPNSCATR